MRDPALLPAAVIYDVELTLDLPAPLSAASGMNAMAHAVEALYARDANPLTGLMAEEAVRALAAALPAIRIEPRDRAARWQALYGAWLAGTCLGTVGMALHYKLCHVLGGSFDLPHAQTHCIVLPNVVAYNAPAAQPAMVRLARALGNPDPAMRCGRWCSSLACHARWANWGCPPRRWKRSSASRARTPTGIRARPTRLP